MDGSILRAVAFLAGLVGLRTGEVLAPHHAPTAPLGFRWIANLGLGVVNGLLVSAVCGACFLLESGGRLSPALPLGRWLPGAVPRIVFCVALLDLVTYGLHRAYHRVPFLWRFHAVHHTDLDLDVSSASRFHTGEVLCRRRSGSRSSSLSASPRQVSSPSRSSLLACAQFQHANVALPERVEDALWRTLVPPAMHRIHHAPNRADTDSNYGTILTLWD